MPTSSGAADVEFSEAEPPRLETGVGAWEQPPKAPD
jgi:hypothetical protein